MQRTSALVCFVAMLGSILVSSRVWDLSKIVLPGHSFGPERLLQVRILSYDPFIAHLENFITEKERRSLRNTSKDLFHQSFVEDEGKRGSTSPGRTSTSTSLLADDEVAMSLRKRAADFQGLMGERAIETIQLVHYEAGQQYKPHFDWFDDRTTALNGGANRISSIFGIVDAECDACGTHFPKIKRTKHGGSWCELLDCTSSTLVVKAIPGNAVFWRNIDHKGDGDVRMLHAGLPVESGFKMGINIWTRDKDAPQEKAPDLRVRKIPLKRRENT